jgi:hypothetical protein
MPDKTHSRSLRKNQVMSLPTSQDPAGAFDYAQLTEFHNPVYDGVFGMLLVAGWFVTLAAAIVLFVVQRFDPDRVDTRWIKRSLQFTALLLIGPWAAGLVMGFAFDKDDAVPNFVGHLQGATTSDPEAEFSKWAKSRYGMELTGVQSVELQKRENKGFMVPSNQTRPIIFEGELVHGIYAAEQIIVVNDEGKELPVETK